MDSNLLLALGSGFGGAILGAAASLVAPLISNRLENPKISDRDMLQYWKEAFDRTSFRGPFTWQSDQARFDKAIRDTLKSIYEGYSYSDSENPLRKGLSKSRLKNKEWLRIMDEVAMHLSKITAALSDRNQSLSAAEIALLADTERDAAVKLLNTMLIEAGITALPVPTEAIYPL